MDNLAREIFDEVYPHLAQDEMPEVMDTYAEMLAFQALLNKEVDVKAVLPLDKLKSLNAGFITCIALFLLNTGTEEILINTLNQFKDTDENYD